jgi:hypothetical protein
MPLTNKQGQSVDYNVRLRNEKVIEFETGSKLLSWALTD